MMATLESLEARIAALEELLRPRVRYARNPFSDISWRYFEVIARNPEGTISREQLFDGVYGHLPEADHPTHSRTVDVNIKRLRARLALHRIHIDTINGFGYKIREGDLRNARLLLQGSSHADGCVPQRDNNSGREMEYVDTDMDSNYSGFPSP